MSTEIKSLQDEGEWLTKEHARLNKEFQEIDKYCKKIDTPALISTLLALDEADYTPERFEEMKVLIAFFRRHKRYEQDIWVYERRCDNYNLRQKQVD